MRSAIHYLVRMALTRISEGCRVRRRPSLGDGYRSSPSHCFDRRRIIRCAWTTALTLLMALAPLSPAATQTREPFDPYTGVRLGLQEQVRIRATVGGGPELTAPRALLIDSRYIYVLDPTAFGIHRFDSRGRWLNTIGRPGDGPGEFRNPSAIGWLSDTLWVADQGLSRLSFFDQDGLFLRSVRFSIISGRELLIPQRALAGDRIAGVPYITPQAAVRLDSLPVLLFDDDGIIQDTLAWRSLGHVAVSIAVPARNGENGESPAETMAIRHPFDLRGFLAWDPWSRWIYVANWRKFIDGETGLELLQVSATGDTVVAVGLPMSRLTVSGREIRSLAREIHAGLPESVRFRVSAQEVAEAFLQQIARPTHAPVDGMIASEDGTVWFGKGGRSGTEGETPDRWAAYQLDHGFAGFVELPLGHSLLSATEGMLWTASFDSLDLVSIVGWRVKWVDR